LRQDAVSLEVPVRIHGSRVKEVVRGTTPHTEPFEEQTTTMIIFPQGGVVRMSTSVSTGQMLVLTNLKTKQDAICRVVKVRTFTNMQGYVEVEFTHPQPTYWGVQFPDQPAPSATKPQAVVAPAAPVKPIQSVQQESKPKPTSDLSWAPAMPFAAAPKPPAGDAAKSPVAASPSKPFTPAPKPESRFISLGTKEEVAAMADAPAAPAPPDLRDIPVVKPVAKALAPVAPAAPVVPPAPIAAPASADSIASSFPSLSIPEVLGDFEASHASASAGSPREAEKADAPAAKAPSASVESASASTSESASTFGSLSGGASLESGVAPVESFGSRFDSGGKAAENAKGSPNFALIAAAIGVLVVVVGGGAFYFRSHNGSASTVPAPVAASTPTAAALPQPADTSAQVLQPATAAVAPVTPPSSTVVAPHGNSVGAVNAQTLSSFKPNAAASAPSQPPSPRASNNAAVQPSPQPAGITGNMVAESVSARPVTAQRDSAADVEAPSVDAAPAVETSGGALPSVLSSDRPAAPAAPDPAVKPSAPARVGGNVKEPRLVNAPQPVYPLMAKQAHIQGDIVVKTTIDESGNVAHMEIVSGPAMLRGAALEALRRWKYAPSMLNGEPIAVQMMVTIKFRM